MGNFQEVIGMIRSELNNILLYNTSNCIDTTTFYNDQKLSFYRHFISHHVQPTIVILFKWTDNLIVFYILKYVNQIYHNEYQNTVPSSFNTSSHCDHRNAYIIKLGSHKSSSISTSICIT